MLAGTVPQPLLAWLVTGAHHVIMSDSALRVEGRAYCGRPSCTTQLA
jgi:hypothetical protein